MSGSASSSAQPWASDRDASHAKEHGKLAVHHTVKAGEAAKNMASDRSEEAKDAAASEAMRLRDKVVHSLHDVEESVETQLKHARADTRRSWNDLYFFFKRHPLLSAFILATTFLLGMMMTRAGMFHVPFTSREKFLMHSPSSPQYKAHQALETILHSYYDHDGSSEGMFSSLRSRRESLPQKTLHGMQRAWHSLSDIMHSSKSSIFGSSDYDLGSAASRLMPSTSKTSRWSPTSSSSSWGSGAPSHFSLFSPSTWFSSSSGYDDDDHSTASAMATLRSLTSGRDSRRSSDHMDDDPEMYDLKKRLSRAVRETPDL